MIIAVKGGAGFTIIEILVVVMLIVMLLNIAIPHILRSRVVANEAVVIGNLRTLANSLDVYRGVNNAFPTNWQVDMYTTPTPDFGPAAFNVDMQAQDVTLRGYRYRYRDPAGFAPMTYVIVVSPATLHITGSRTFWVEERGAIFHCLGESSSLTLPEGVAFLNEAPSACP